jgi:Ca2+-transporting ATPase
MESKQKWHAQSAGQVKLFFQTKDTGLTAAQIERHRQQFGANIIPSKAADSLLTIFARQFKSPLIYILLVASVIVAFIQDIVDSFVIVGVLLVNAIIGTIQEGRAQSTLESLKNLITTKAGVWRGDEEIIIPDTEVVCGDILVLREGDKVPADARIITADNLVTDESTLTGESLPVNKQPDVLPATTSDLSDQTNMVFKGTHVVSGTGRAIVVAVGTNTVIGDISKRILNTTSEDPLQRDIKQLSRYIIVLMTALCALVFALGLWRHIGLGELVAVTISLFVFIIPEGLPVVLTVILATGVWRMSQKNALVKKLQAVESLGQAKIIAVDKTGTITKNELMVEQLWAHGMYYQVTGSGYEPDGHLTTDNGDSVLDVPPAVQKLLIATTSVASSDVVWNKEHNTWRVIGEPTEAALTVLGRKLGFSKTTIEAAQPKIAELPFTYLTKYHAVIHQTSSGMLLSLAGATENVLAVCEHAHRKEIEAAVQELSKKGLRVLAVAAKLVTSNSFNPGNMHGLSFLGLVAMRDVLRPEVPAAIAATRTAGLKVIMITGDHQLTATAIATEAGILAPGNTVITGKEIEALTDQELAKAVENATVFARVTPEHKTRIIEAFKLRGEVIAMTGDGVNDAPSLVAADLGVAMGKTGTEVAKSAADIILLDDNFGSIVDAVEEGRNIYLSLKKALLYFFSTSLGGALVFIASMVFNLPLPLLATQIIWCNFVTGGFLVAALSLEPRRGSLLQAWESGKQKLLDSKTIFRMLYLSIPIGLSTFVLFVKYSAADRSVGYTVTLTALVVAQLINVWNCRSRTRSVFGQSWVQNRYLIITSLVVIGLTLASVYVPIFQAILRTTALTGRQWLEIIVVCSSVLVFEEFRKLIVWVSKKA